MATEFHVFSPAEYREILASVLYTRAIRFREEAAAEAPKNNANMDKIAKLHWGADQLIDIGDFIRMLPDGEDREIEPVIITVNEAVEVGVPREVAESLVEEEEETPDPDEIEETKPRRGRPPRS